MKKPIKTMKLEFVYDNLEKSDNYIKINFVNPSGPHLSISTIRKYKQAINEEKEKSPAQDPDRKNKIMTRIMEQDRHNGRSTDKRKVWEQEVYRALNLKKVELIKERNRLVKKDPYHIANYKKVFQTTKEEIKGQLSHIPNYNFNYYYTKVSKNICILPKRGYFDVKEISEIRTELEQLGEDLKRNPEKYPDLSQDNDGDGGKDTVIQYVRDIVNKKIKCKPKPDVIMDHFSPQIQKLKNMIRYEIDFEKLNPSNL